MIANMTATATAAEPHLRHVFDIHAECASALDLGTIPGGHRIMLPVTGGNVEGDLTAEIIPGGADYQMVSSDGTRTEFKAVYTLRTDDGRLINVTNKGIATSAHKGDYFTTSPTFEAPADSPYDWLNNRIFVCRPVGFGPGTVHLRVWLVD